VGSEMCIRDSYRLLRQWEFSFRADQVIDLIKLVVDVPVAMAFGEGHVDADRVRGGMRIHTVNLTSFPVRLVEQRWSLSAENAQHLPALWQSLVAGPNADRLRFALRRWGSALQRKWREDELIDLWIGLEGLFKRESENRGSSDLVAARIARLLGLERTQRKLATRQLARSYDVRSYIAHGQIDYEERSLHDGVGDADHMLRQALIHLLESAEAIDTLGV